MGVEESYRRMLDQLAKHPTSAFDELMRPTLLLQEATRKSLTELMTPVLLQQEDARRSLAELMTPALLHQEAARKSLAELMTPALLQQEAARKSLTDVYSRHELFLAHELESSTHVLTSVRMSVLQAASQWEKDLGRSRNLIAAAAATFDAHWRETFRHLGEIQGFGLSVPKLAIEVWSAELVWDRIGLIEHSFKNVSALQQLQNTAIALEPASTSLQSLFAAGQFVFNHGDLLRRLPPTLPPDERVTVDQNARRHGNEEVGAKLDNLLSVVSPELQELRRQSWRRLSEGTSGARLAMLGLREVFNEILRLVASDDEVIATDSWRNRADKTKTRPTRQMRLIHVMGSDAIELSALLEFDASIEAAHKFAHTFADDTEIVRVSMSQLESWIYLILVYARKGL